MVDFKAKNSSEFAQALYSKSFINKAFSKVTQEQLSTLKAISSDTYLILINADDLILMDIY